MRALQDYILGVVVVSAQSVLCKVSPSYAYFALEPPVTFGSLSYSAPTLVHALTSCKRDDSRVEI